MQAFSGKKMGPPGPRTLLVCPGPFRVRYLLEVSILVCCNTGKPCSHVSVYPRHRSDYSRAILGIHPLREGVLRQI